MLFNGYISFHFLKILFFSHRPSFQKDVTDTFSLCSTVISFIMQSFTLRFISINTWESSTQEGDGQMGFRLSKKRKKEKTIQKAKGSMLYQYSFRMCGAVTGRRKASLRLEGWWQVTHNVSEASLNKKGSLNPSLPQHLSSVLLCACTIDEKDLHQPVCTDTLPLSLFAEPRFRFLLPVTFYAGFSTMTNESALVFHLPKSFWGQLVSSD